MAKKKYMAQAIRKGITRRTFKYNSKKGTAYHWTYILRAKDKRKRELIARGIERAVKNNKRISYSNEAKKNARLFDAVKPLGFDCLRLRKRATTNCCNLASVACRYAGIKTPRKSSARTLPHKWEKYGFYVIPYKHGKTKLKRGDILDATIKPKVHTAIYLGGGEKR